jgi:DNA-binding transcriptional regulator YiaG
MNPQDPRLQAIMANIAALLLDPKFQAIASALAPLIADILAVDRTAAHASPEPGSSKPQPVTENPIRALRAQMGMSRRLFAIHIGRSANAVEAAEKGLSRHLHRGWEVGLERAGIDYHALAKAYDAWRESLTRESAATTRPNIVHLTHANGA